MSVYLGTQLLSGVATNTISNAHDLFDFKWTDHELNDQSWLNADTFSWQDGTVYSDAFNHLVADYNNGELHTETIGSYTIDYILAPDGHKIVTQYNETTVANIYDESGVAWYYVLDRVDDRFKLPRTKYGFNGLRDEVGKYIPETLPNVMFRFGAIVTGSGNDDWNINATSHQTWSGNTFGSSSGTRRYYTLDMSSGNSTYQNNAPVQERATQMYLYFYVGQFSQSATEQTAGLNASLFNSKVDLNAANLSTTGKSLISGLGMPSDRNEFLTLGASGSEYTAPANGWFVGTGNSSATGQYIQLVVDGKINTRIAASGSGQLLRAYVPARKGSLVGFLYNTTSNNGISFVYAVGSESEAS